MVKDLGRFRISIGNCEPKFTQKNVFFAKFGHKTASRTLLGMIILKNPFSFSNELTNKGFYTIEFLLNVFTFPEMVQ